MTAQTPPGRDPWHVDRETSFSAIGVYDSKGRLVAQVRTYGRPDAEENAAKIAAVPQIIDSLKCVRARARAGLPYDGTFVDEALKAAGEGP